MTNFFLEARHICTKPFKATMPDELTLAVGDVVDVLAKCSDGWWKVMYVITTRYLTKLRITVWSTLDK